MVKDLLLVLLLCLCKSFQRTLSSWPSVSGVCRSSGKRVQSYTKYPFPPNILGKNCGFFSKFLKILTKQEKTKGCLIIILSKKKNTKGKGGTRKRKEEEKEGRKKRKGKGQKQAGKGTEGEREPPCPAPYRKIKSLDVQANCFSDGRYPRASVR